MYERLWKIRYGGLIYHEKHTDPMQAIEAIIPLHPELRAGFTYEKQDDMLFVTFTPYKPGERRDIPPVDTYVHPDFQSSFSMITDIILGSSIREKQMSDIMEKIDAALIAGDREAFLVYSDAYKLIVGGNVCRINSAQV